ncbi:unnamed protein product [Polarella glacialis]|uniref:Uncharacterized protein n=1 Tax=Polarella glacialis TaxID=89957 RepID=A0A813HCF2_POLGL|nr:unnamed protein product [Polarella glacialis]
MENLHRMGIASPLAHEAVRKFGSDVAEAAIWAVSEEAQAWVALNMHGSSRAFHGMPAFSHARASGQEDGDVERAANILSSPSQQHALTRVANPHPRSLSQDLLLQSESHQQLVSTAAVFGRASASDARQQLLATAAAFGLEPVAWQTPVPVHAPYIHQDQDVASQSDVLADARLPHSVRTLWRIFCHATQAARSAATSHANLRREAILQDAQQEFMRNVPAMAGDGGLSWAYLDSLEDSASLNYKHVWRQWVDMARRLATSSDAGISASSSASSGVASIPPSQLAGASPYSASVSAKTRIPSAHRASAHQSAQRDSLTAEDVASHSAANPLPVTWPLSRDHAVMCRSDWGLAQSVPRGLGLPDFLNDPAGEVDYWFLAVASAIRSGRDDGSVWSLVPLYTQYIREHTVAEIVAQAADGVAGLQGLAMDGVRASHLPRVLGQTTLLPFAVASEYLHRACGLPAYFAFDMFQACLASCLHKELGVLRYAAKKPDRICKGRWWAAPTGDPNAGKSPTFSAFSFAFTSLIEKLKHIFPWSHTCGAGNTGKFQEKMRNTNGTCLLWGPEARAMLDPKFPACCYTDPAKYLDMVRLLETASGGLYEWGTATEERKVRAARVARDRQASAELTNRSVAIAGSASQANAALIPDPIEARPLVFPHTNVNMCVFQQFHLLTTWWAEVENNFNLGFSARVLFSFTQRAIVDPEVDMLPERLPFVLMARVWETAACTWGPKASPDRLRLMPTLEGQQSIRSFYYLLANLEGQGRWGSACKAALGKMEYHVPAAALLTGLAEKVLAGAEGGQELSDNALKCGFRRYDKRLFFGCAVVDYEAFLSKKPTQTGRCGRGHISLQARVLLSCAKDPITLTEMSQRMGDMKGAARFDARVAALRALEASGLGTIKETRRRIEGDQRQCNVEFHRAIVNDSVREKLAELGVPLSVFMPLSASTPVALGQVPAMEGSGLSWPLSSCATSCGTSGYSFQRQVEECPLKSSSCVQMFGGGMKRTSTGQQDRVTPPKKDCVVERVCNTSDARVRLFDKSDLPLVSAAASGISVSQPCHKQRSADVNISSEWKQQMESYAMADKAGRIRKIASLAISLASASWSEEDIVSQMEALQSAWGETLGDQDADVLPAASQDAASSSSQLQSTATKRSRAKVDKADRGRAQTKNADANADCEIIAEASCAEGSQALVATSAAGPKTAIPIENGTVSKTCRGGKKKCSVEVPGKPEEEPDVIVTRKQERIEDILTLTEQWKSLIAWAEENTQKRIYGSGFRPIVSKKRWDTRAPKILCLCAGVSDSKGKVVTCPVTFQAKHDSDTHLFSITEHGVHAQGKAKRQARSLAFSYPVILKVPCEMEGKTSAALVAEANKWSQKAFDIAEDKPFDVSIEPGFRLPKSALTDDQFWVVLVCTSCDEEQVPQCSWKGLAHYDSEDKYFQVHACGTHASKQRTKAGVATTEQRCKMLASQSSQAIGKLVAINHCEASPPTKLQAADMVKNKARTKTHEPDHVQRGWTAEDILDAVRNADIREATLKDCLHFPAEQDDMLFMLEYKSYLLPNGSPAFTALFASPCLLRAPQLLENSDYVKVAANATWRDIFGNFCTIPFGVLSKRYSGTTERSCKLGAWCSHFSPVLFAVSSSENGHAYEMGYQLLSKVPCRTIPWTPLAARVRQVHGNWSSAVEKARATVFHDSLRAGDFFHLWKNVQANLLSYFSERDTQSNIQQVYNALIRSRTYCTTLAEFHLFWILFFDQMVRPVRQGGWDEKVSFVQLGGLPTHACSLGQHVARNRSKRSMRMCFGLPWSTKEEDSWHTCSRICFSNILLIDRPNRDDPVARSGDILNKIGRSTAVQLNACPEWIHQVSLPGEAGQAFVMPRSLLRWQLKSAARGAASDQGDWVPVDAGQLQCDSSMAQTMARMSVEKDGQLLLRLWKETGIATATRAGSLTFDVKKWYFYRYHKVVVLTGPEADRIWRAPHSDNFLCPCLPFALGARCEHGRCAQSRSRPGDLTLTIVGSTKTGRLAKPIFSARGMSFAMVLQAGAAAERQAATIKAARSQQTSFPPCSGDLLQESEHTNVRSDASALAIRRSRDSGANSSRAVATEGDSARFASPRGPTEHYTNFDRIWAAVQNGKQVPKSHAAIGVRKSEDAAIRFAFEALKKQNPDFDFAQIDRSTVKKPKRMWKLLRRLIHQAVPPAVPPAVLPVDGLLCNVASCS